MKSRLISSSGKSKIILGFLVATFVCGAFAILTNRFTTWDAVESKSSEIIIVQCTKTPEPFSGSVNGVFEAEIVVSAVLKGRTNLGPAMLTSMYCPRQGENYLVFCHYFEKTYQAMEDYRIVPLGIYFQTNVLAGKKLDEQIKMLQQYRLGDIEIQMKQLEEEKARLEQGVKKQ